jgi:glycosyltransferase involved in cell wall biosynthesis
MNVTYLLEDTDITGRARTALAQADALIALGHRVRIATTGAPVTWRASRAEWLYVDDFSAVEDEIVLAEPPAGFEIVDAEVYRARVARENHPMRVLLCGASQDEAKHVDDGYGAAAHARWFHQRFDLIRVSPWAPSRDEPLDAVQEFHVGLTTAEMTRLMHSCDAIIAPEERFSLSTAEALAAGLPATMNQRNAVELGEKLIELLSDAELRDRLRKRGWAEAERWRAANVAARLEEWLVERRRPGGWPGGVPPP